MSKYNTPSIPSVEKEIRHSIRQLLKGRVEDIDRIIEQFQESSNTIIVALQDAKAVRDRLEEIYEALDGDQKQST